ncbi:MAG: glycosyltransferase [Cellvibrionaceae bacterium]
MPLKVLHIASGDRWAGAEVQLLTLLKALKQRDCVPSAILLNEGELADRLRNEGVSVVILSESENGFFSLLKKIKEQLIQLRPDVVHTHRQKENILGGLANKLSINVPSCRTLHGAPEFNPSIKQKVQCWLDDFVGRWLQRRIVAVSDDMKQLLEKKFGKKKIATIHNGVDIELLSLESAKTLFIKNESDEFHVGIVGRIEPVKRVDLFLNIARTLLQTAKHISWKFHIVGDGSKKGEMVELANELGLNGSVIFHGHQLAVAPIIASLDVIVMCSDHEGMPMTALETIALGTGLVAHDVGGLKSFREFGGVSLVENNVVQKYCSTLTGLAESGIPKNDFNVFRQRFSSEAMASETMTLYRELLA